MNDFNVCLNGNNLEIQKARVSAMPFNTIWPGHQRVLEQTELNEFVSFSMDKPTEIEITVKEAFENVVVRPLSKKVTPKVCGNTIYLTVEKAGQYTLELDGNHRVLYIFANPKTDFKINAEDENVIYYPKGEHDAGLIELLDNQTLFIDEGAVVYGYVRAIKAKNIRIIGFGILDGSKEIRDGSTNLVPKDILRRNPKNDIYSPILKDYPTNKPEEIIKGTSIVESKEQFTAFLKKWNTVNSPIQLYCCENIEINGITIRDSCGFTVMPANCKNLVCDNVKLVGMWRYNSDGIDLFNCRDCVIKNSFLRTFDDSIVLKGIQGFDLWNMENILIENCVVWCDWGGTLEIGAETNANEYKNITYRNCDCIHNSADAMRIQNCDRAYIHDILYEDIRVEYSKHDLAQIYQQDDSQEFISQHAVANLIQLVINNNISYSNADVKGRISDITFRNITVYTDGECDMPQIIFSGLDREHNVENVLIENLSQKEKIEVFKNEFCDNIKIM